jgi:hypothetical protein
LEDDIVFCLAAYPVKRLPAFRMTRKWVRLRRKTAYYKSQVLKLNELTPAKWAFTDYGATLWVAMLHRITQLEQLVSAQQAEIAAIKAAALPASKPIYDRMPAGIQNTRTS